MADLHRKRRHIALLRQLLKVAIAERNVSAGSSLARLIARMEGWDTAKDPEPPVGIAAQEDIVALLAKLSTGREPHESQAA